MGRYIIKLEEFYLEWSTIVDAPVTYGMKIDDFKEYYKEEYGSHGMKDLPDRLERIEENGVSAYPPDNDLDSLLAYNRAGKNESVLTKEEIIKEYCI